VGLILEGVVTTISPDLGVNIAPMGPIVDPGMQTLTLRPYCQTQTYKNLLSHGEGVFHVIDDVLLLARAALGPIEPPPLLVPADHIRGCIIASACRAYEFQVTQIDPRLERAVIKAKVIHVHRMRDFFGFNRAKHAVLEAAILATRTDLLPLEQITSEMDRLRPMVDKTGGPDEHQAFTFLLEYVTQIKNGRQTDSSASDGSRARLGVSGGTSRQSRLPHENTS
jgi:hypothetical protein